MSMTEIARSIGITKNRWATHEYARAPLKYWIGWQVCRKFHISQIWLATGSGLVRARVPEAVENLNLHGKNALFTEVYDAWFDGLLARSYALFSNDPKSALFAFTDSGEVVMGDKPISATSHELETVTEFIVEMVKSQLGLLPSTLRGAYASALVESSTSFIKSHSSRIQKFLMRSIQNKSELVTSTEAKKLDIDNPGNYTDVTSMKNLWQPWQKRLAQLCKKEGVRAQIARELDVSRQAASNWVAGTSEPTANYALRLIEWIKSEEAKDKP